jgi:hypothetical protein
MPAELANVERTSLHLRLDQEKALLGVIDECCVRDGFRSARARREHKLQARFDTVSPAY